MTSAAVDLIIIGAGPAGMAAACEARDLGLSVILLDEQASVGGQIYRSIEAAPSERRAILGPDYVTGQSLAADFRASGTDYIGGALVWNVSTDGTVNYVLNGKSQTTAGKYILLASGAMERPFPIAGWTLPGVMGAGAAQILLKGSGALPKSPVILAGCGPLLYLLAWQYLRAGVRLQALVDTTMRSGYLHAASNLLGALKGWRDLSKGLRLLSSIRHHDLSVYSGASKLSVEGEQRAEGLSFDHRGKRVRLAASQVLLHQGVVPNVQLSLALRAEHTWNSHQLCWQPITDDWGRLGDMPIYVAGDSRAIVGAKASAVQGRLTALAIAEQLGMLKHIASRAMPLRRELRTHTAIRPFLDSLYRPRDENRIPAADEVTVCRCEEVTAGQIRGYVELGCLGPNQTKAFGRCGMGPCQGRFCGLTVTEIIAQARGTIPEEVGYYRVRPPIKPVMLGDFVS